MERVKKNVGNIFKNTIREEIDIKKFMNNRKIDLFAVTDKKQQRWGCSFVPLGAGTIINYDISLEEKTLNSLEREGIRFNHFHRTPFWLEAAVSDA